MTTRQLSSEIVSLIHHVELNKSGWWKKAVGQVIKGVLWKEQVPLTLDELKQRLDRELGIPFSNDALQRQIEYLKSQNAVSGPLNERYKLTEHTRQALTATHATTLGNQEKCHQDFHDSCTQSCPELNADDIWDKFTQALIEAVRVAGANLYHLLADGNLEREVDWLSRFLKQFPSQSHNGLRQVLTGFFSPSNTAGRSQVMNLLTAHFFAEAAQLRPETIAALEGSQKKKIIRVVLDTNFLFSILQLHDNPADEAALSLVDLAHQNGNPLEIKLFVLPSTVEEAQKTLRNQMHMIERIRTTRAMAQAALSEPLTGIAKRFFAAASLSPELTAQTFFQPYTDDLRTILLDKGIHILDTSAAAYSQRPEVIDDVLEEQEREKRDLPENRRKGYETLMHDVVLWHAVKDRRGGDATSPFQVEYWAVSIDWRLIAFDRRKRAADDLKVPVVLHPTNLVQLIQFWVPRSEKLERSLIDALRLPMFFQSFDPEDERATVKVLEAISRFENVRDLPEISIKNILANQALRVRIREADASNDEVFELVREELLTEHKETVTALGEARGVLAQTEAALTSEKGIRKTAEEQLGQTSAELEEAKRQARVAEEKAAQAEAARLKQESDSRAALLEQEQRALASETRLKKLQFSIMFWGLPLLAGGAIGYVAYGYLSSHAVWRSWAAAAVALIPFAGLCLYAPRHLSKHPEIEAWWLSRLTVTIGRKAIIGPGGAGLMAVYQGGIWDAAKAALKIGGGQ